MWNRAEYVLPKPIWPEGDEFEESRPAAAFLVFFAACCQLVFLCFNKIAWKMLFGPLVCTSIWFYSTGHFCDHLPLSLFPHFWVLCILDSMIDVYTWQIIARSFFFPCDYLLEIVMVQYVTVKPLGGLIPLTADEKTCPLTFNYSRSPAGVGSMHSSSG